MFVRLENAADVQPIRSLVTAAFQDAPHSSGTEADIVDALRAGSALTLSLVAIKDGVVVGYVAFSPIRISGKMPDWFGLGPVAVERSQRRQGVGRLLTEDGLNRLRASGAGGCVVLGDPTYYARFGFEPDPALMLAGVPAEYFQRLCFQGE
ncbi:GNAT family N-acetyltransferase [Pseudoroseomonas ludipueritiae]|uniref:N-acetyltransferase n=1 Tax=Pseudoroseomonas ludipueritiae TaxID=198093 RepID=A0ABR7R7K3_9PROT|nr:N-acetyltransferase [Pseudoroseomonas ludipueritiae]MBC9177731.1 N-acetyltransferase [Pseudoroseomonas ludipueritiae]MCG7360589.1 N-acetyltransferase [Roseomonas sp. ACRSG]